MILSIMAILPLGNRHTSNLGWMRSGLFEKQVKYLREKFDARIGVIRFEEMDVSSDRYEKQLRWDNLLKIWFQVRLPDIYQDTWTLQRSL